jgi:sterol desaturase/sphingolipid hydroxylase (fatty acid hydroxylase superfamily)
MNLVGFKYLLTQPSVSYFAGIAGVAAWILWTMPWTWTRAAVVLIGGPTSWTFEEYVIHRFVLHDERWMGRVHGKHHERPTDKTRIFVPIIITVFLGVIHYIPIALYFGTWIACANLVSHIFCYACFEWVHYDSHIWRSAFLRGPRQFHLLHHKSMSVTQNYGFTSASWDLIFGTCDVETMRGWAVLWIPIPVLPFLFYDRLYKIK